MAKGKSTKPRPLAERFWERVQKTDGCWLWTGALASTGYGEISIGRMQRSAHRVSWELNVGAVPDGLHVLHNCPGDDNPRCVNPAHLWLGTHGENMRDMVAKGRSTKGRSNPLTRGERHGTAKLTEEDVLEIRSLYAAGGVSQTALARRFGVGQPAIWHVITRKRWRHL